MLPHQNRIIQNRFLLALGLTGLILVIEIIGGLWTGSLALLSDAAHVFMDVFALALSYAAMRLSALPPDDRHTYGYHRLEVLAALANGITLGGIAVGIFVEAYHRFLTPEPVRSVEMLAIASVGLVVNLVVAFVLGWHTHDDEDNHPEHDVNVRSAYLHVVGDAVSSVGVIVAAILLTTTGWTWIDPAMSVLIGVLIMVSSYRVLRSSIHILVEGVPEGVSLQKVSQSIGSVPGVLEVHDLHVWNICSGHIALSAHVVVCDNAPQENHTTMSALKQRLSQGFGIEHTTVQFENATCGEAASACRCK
jgi:cobalt-zinc-cadmium efflux system protein